MMQAFFISIIICFSTGLPVDEPSYYRFSTEQFFDLNQVHTSIDLNNFDKDLMEAAIFYASNEVRKQKRKSGFNYDSILNEAARFHADYLEEKKIIDHLNKHKKKYHTPYDRTKAFNGDFTSVAENLARLPVYQLGEKGEFFMDKSGRLLDQDRNPLKASTYASLARQVVDGWMNSKGHRENMLGDFALLGIGVSDISFNKNGIPELYLIQKFGNK